MSWRPGGRATFWRRASFWGRRTNFYPTPFDITAGEEGQLEDSKTDEDDYCNCFFNHFLFSIRFFCFCSRLKLPIKRRTIIKPVVLEDGYLCIIASFMPS